MSTQTSHRLKPILFSFIGIMALLQVIVAVIATFSLQRVLENDEKEHTIIHTLKHNMVEARFHIVQVQQFLTDASATGERDPLQEAAAHYQALQGNLQAIAKFDASLSGEISQITRLTEQFHQVGLRMAEAYITQGRDAGNVLMKAPQDGFDDRASALTQQIEAMAAKVDAMVRASEQTTQETVNTLRLVVVGLSSALAVLIVLGGGWLYRKVFGMLGGEPGLAVSLAQHIAQGDLTRRIALDTLPGDSLLAALGDMRTHLHGVTHTIHGLSRQLDGDAHALAATSSQMEAGAHEQSDATRAMAAAMEQIQHSIAQLSQQSGEVGHEASEASQMVDACAELIHQSEDGVRDIASQFQQAAGAIGALHQQTDAIASITQTIHDIADQTNLLALNAAIEAARAGETGRGFAVVADEVRKLAERTGSATLEISGQIATLSTHMRHVVTVMEQGVDASQQGVAHTRQVSQAMGGIRTNTERINEHIHGVALALSEQQQAMGELGQRLEVVVGMSDTHHHTIETTAHAASQLTANAHALAEAVAHFKT